MFAASPGKPCRKQTENGGAVLAPHQLGLATPCNSSTADYEPVCGLQDAAGQGEGLLIHPTQDVPLR